jgi:hypothetical protein
MQSVPSDISMNGAQQRLLTCSVEPERCCKHPHASCTSGGCPAHSNKLFVMQVAVYRVLVLPTYRMLLLFQRQDCVPLLVQNLNWSTSLSAAIHSRLRDCVLLPAIRARFGARDNLQWQHHGPTVPTPVSACDAFCHTSTDLEI